MNYSYVKYWLIFGGALAVSMVALAYSCSQQRIDSTPRVAEDLRGQDSEQVLVRPDQPTAEPSRSVTRSESLVNYRTLDPGEWSAQDYENFIPLICGTAVHQLKIGAGQFALPDYYAWMSRLDRGLARGPVLEILRGDDIGMVTAAAYTAGVVDIPEATPLLIDAMQRKQRGRWVNNGSLSQAYFLHCAAALGKRAARGDEQALQFLSTHTTEGSWKSSEIRLLSLDEETSSQYLARYTIDGLVFCPTEAAIEAIQRGRSSYEWADERIRLMRAFIESGDDLEKYHAELTTAGLVQNKYLEPEEGVSE